MRFFPTTWRRTVTAGTAVLLLVFAGCDRAAPADAVQATPTADTTADRSSDTTAAPTTDAASTAATSDAAQAAQAAAADETAPPVPPVPVGDVVAAKVEARDAATSSGSLIRFERLQHDFGRIWDVDEQQTTFAFTNVGDEELVITQIKASCGCTTPALEKKRYLPGETGEIGVAFKPKGFGRQTKTVTVLSNSTRGPSVRLSIVSDIVPFVTFEPRRLQLDEIALGEPHVARVVVTSEDPELEIRSVRVNGAGRTHLAARLLPEEEAVSAASGDEIASRRVVEVTVADTTPWGPIYGWVDVDVVGRLPDSGDAVEHSTRVMVSASVFGELSADQTMFRVQVVPPGESFENRVRLTRAGDTPFQILGVTTERSTLTDVAVRAEPVAGSGGSAYDLVLTGDSGSYLGPIRGNVRVTTDVPGEQEISLDFNGIVREPNK